MKRMLLILALLTLVAGNVRAGAWIGYTLNSSLLTTDQLCMIDDPLGTWAVNRVSISVLWDLLRISPGEIGGTTPGIGNFSSLVISPSATPGFWASDSGAPGADKSVGNLQWNDDGVGGDGTEYSDFWISVYINGSETQVLFFDASDDRWETTKAITGLVSVIEDTDGDVALTAEECAGTKWINNTGANEYFLPAAANGLNCCFYADSAHAVTITPNAASNDNIKLEGSAGGVDASISSDGTNGDYACVVAVDGTYWIVLDHFGTWGVP